MDAWSRVPRTTPMKIAAALVVAGALSIGLVASSTHAASAAPKQASRALGVRLKVINKDPARTTVTICAVNVGCKAPATLGVGQSVDYHAGQVDGWIRYADGYTVYFHAVNPTVGRPYIDLKDAAGVQYGGKVWQTQFCKLGPDGISPLFAGCLPRSQHVLAPHTFNLAVGQCLPQNAGYVDPKPPPSYTFTAQRANDTGHYKSMTLTAFRPHGAQRCP